NGAAVDVDLAAVDVEGLQVTQHDGGEGLVDLDQVDVGERHAGFLQNLVRHVDRAGEHDRRLGPDIGEGPDARARLDAGGGARFLAADQHGGGAIDDAGRIARMMDMLDGFDLGML